jgi:hypothetical protein
VTHPCLHRVPHPLSQTAGRSKHPSCSMLHSTQRCQHSMHSSQLQQLRAAAAVSSAAALGPGREQGGRAELAWVHHCTHPGEGTRPVGGTQQHIRGVAVHTAHHKDRPGVYKADHTVADRTGAARRPGPVAGTVHTAVPCWGPVGDSLAEAGSLLLGVGRLLVLVDNPCCRLRASGILAVVLPCWHCSVRKQ